MGMVGCYAAMPAAKLAELRDDEDAIEAFLHPDDGEGEPEISIDVDKAWHGIQYLLTGEPWGGPSPLGLAIMGGEELGPDVGYGPARVLTPAQVVEVAKALAALPTKTLRIRFDPQDMEKKEIYPQIIWVRDGQQALEYVLEYYEKLAAFYQDAAKRGDAVIQWLS